jgi:beta-lactamase class A
MQQLHATKRHAGVLPKKILVVSTTLLLVMGSALLLSSSSISFQSTAGLSRRSTSGSTSNASESYPWDGDTQTTAPISEDFQPGSTPLEVSPLFAAAYRKQNGATSLGVPLTAAFPTGQGWIQFFASGALLLPTTQTKHALDPEDLQEHQDPLIAPIAAGTKDANTGIVRLALLPSLLMAGSQVPLIDGSSLTYADLRAATLTSSAGLAEPKTFSPSQINGQGIFIQEGTNNGQDAGRMVPLPIWSYIQQANVSPDGWETDFGPPLTAALTVPVTRNGIVHNLLIQAFWNDAVVLDQGASNQSANQSTSQPISKPVVSLLDTGVAYLRTFGPPPVVLATQQAAWAQTNTALLGAPGTGATVAHVGQDFPLTLPGNSAWNNGMLWYQAQWTTPRATYQGWAAASDLTFTSPGNVPGWASLDALSPDLAAYLAGTNGSVGVAIYDITRQRYYTSDDDGQFTTGSSVKVPIMLTLLDLTESEGREPDDGEMTLLTTMIENSNNDSAAALYYGEVGGADGVGSYMQRIGISGLDLDPDAFGWSTITPMTMVNLLTKLYDGTILTASDRQLALSLMEQIEPDQQIGVGDTSPPGATVAMKDGWVIGPDGLWTMNSSGIVSDGSETYIISVYTEDQNALPDGWSITEHVCGTVAALLTPSR